jgi:predicted RNA-binding Zn-ribbon protein involved in translation (DUF1610 family)
LEWGANTINGGIKMLRDEKEDLYCPNCSNDFHIGNAEILECAKGRHAGEESIKCPACSIWLIYDRYEGITGEY